MICVSVLKIALNSPGLSSRKEKSWSRRTADARNI